MHGYHSIIQSLRIASASLSEVRLTTATALDSLSCATDNVASVLASLNDPLPLQLPVLLLSVPESARSERPS